MNDLQDLYGMVAKKAVIERELQDVKLAITDLIVSSPALIKRYMKIDQKAIDRDMAHDGIEGRHHPVQEPAEVNDTGIRVEPAEVKKY
jgi:hypothetical protein